MSDGGQSVSGWSTVKGIRKVIYSFVWVQGPWWPNYMISDQGPGYFDSLFTPEPSIVSPTPFMKGYNDCQTWAFYRRSHSYINCASSTQSGTMMEALTFATATQTPMTYCEEMDKHTGNVKDGVPTKSSE